MFSPLTALQVAASPLLQSVYSAASQCSASTVPVGDGVGAAFIPDTAPTYLLLALPWHAQIGSLSCAEHQGALFVTYPLSGFPCCSDRSSLRKSAEARGLRAQAILAEQVQQRGNLLLGLSCF